MSPGAKTRSLFKLIGFYLFFLLLFRVAFYLSFHEEEQSLFSADVLKAFWLGSRFDLRVSVYMVTPLAILGLLPWFSWERSERHKKFWVYFQATLTSALLAIYFMDFGYYSYLNSRLSTSVGQFFENPMISLQMMWESYPLLLILAAHALLTFLSFLWIRTFAFSPVEIPKVHLGIRIGKGLALFLLWALGIHCSFSQYPLRWSEAFFSANNFVSHLGLNPAHYLWDTYSNPDTDYEIEKVRKYNKPLATYLGYQPDTDTDLLRETRPSDIFSKNMNVIYIVMESYAAYKMSKLGNIPGASDTMDALAEKGWLYTNFYTPTEGTARSMFCSLTGIPDINAESTSSRNPRVVEQNTLVNAFHDHEKYYFIGGSANWGNIRGIYENNIDQLNMYEENDFDKPKTDVWGLNDLDLFRETAKVLKTRKSNQPFFAMIQAAGFHRPYTIPDDRGDFQLKELSKAEMEKYGWKHNEEYNSFRFSDYALGEFLRLLQQRPDIYNNTLFVIHGDHGINHFGAEHLSDGYKKFYLSRFHVPLVIYSPRMKEPRVIDTMVSQVDVMTSITGAMGIKASHRSLGRNIFELKTDEPSYAFSYVYYDRPVTKMLYDKEYLAITDKTGEVSALYKYNEDPDTNLIDKDPGRVKAMSDILHGIYESSRYLIQNNKRLDYKAGTMPN